MIQEVHRTVAMPKEDIQDPLNQWFPTFFDWGPLLVYWRA